MARRLVAPDGLIKQTEVALPNGAIRRYDSSSGYVTVTDSDAKALRQEGFHEASLSGVSSRSSGRRCTRCGFGSFFTTCGRCGGPCSREGETS
jgi:hypothetical protein